MQSYTLTSLTSYKKEVLDIWKEFSVLLLDKTGLSARQKDFIYSFLKMVPPDLHNLRTISVVDNLGRASPEVSLSGRGGSINIFGLDIGVAQGNEFPDDVPPTYSDVFCIVVAHEVNHVVDAFYIARSSELRSRKDDLIRRAGNNHINYLRSMLPDGFFSSAPQEFFASISNQWFANSSLTLRLALLRFDAGHKEPLNQFLFFAEVYSRKGGSTLFYNIDTQGNILRREVPVIRDETGRITAIIDGETIYSFTLDANGNVISYSKAQAPRLYDVSFDVQPRIGSLVIDGTNYSASQMPVSFKWAEGSSHSFEVPLHYIIMDFVRFYEDAHPFFDFRAYVFYHAFPFLFFLGSMLFSLLQYFLLVENFT